MKKLKEIKYFVLGVWDRIKETFNCYLRNVHTCSIWKSDNPDIVECRCGKVKHNLKTGKYSYEKT